MQIKEKAKKIIFKVSLEIFAIDITQFIPVYNHIGDCCLSNLLKTVGDGKTLIFTWITRSEKQISASPFTLPVQYSHLQYQVESELRKQKRRVVAIREPTL